MSDRVDCVKLFADASGWTEECVEAYLRDAAAACGPPGMPGVGADGKTPADCRWECCICGARNQPHTGRCSRCKAKQGLSLADFLRYVNNPESPTGPV